MLCRYHDAQAKCPLTTGNGYIDYHYNGTAPVDTDSCYGYFQATYTSDAGMTNISHLPLDYLVDYAGNLDTVSTSTAAQYCVAVRCASNFKVQWNCPACVSCSYTCSNTECGVGVAAL